MSTREALIQEILKQPDSLLRELQRYLTLLVELRQKESNGGPGHSQTHWPQGYFQKTAGHSRMIGSNAQTRYTSTR
jgi:hypothetical protein